MRTVPFIVTMVVVAVAHPAFAQSKASAVPISRDTITLQVSVGGSTATVTIQNGALGRIAKKDGPTVGLLPVLKGGAVEVVAMLITADDRGNETVRHLSRTGLSLGQAVQLPGTPLGIVAELLNTAPPLGPQETDTGGPCTTCCVTCGEFTVCGCRVVADCGSCCCPAACTCSDAASIGERSASAGCPTTPVR